MGRINPTFIDNLGRHMGDVYGAVTDQILINLARYFPYYKPGQPVPKSSFEYQSVMLAQMGQFTEETVDIIRNSLSGADDALKNVISQAIVESVKKAQPDLLKGMSQNLIFPTKRPIMSPEQMNAYWFYYQQSANKLNLVNTVMLESTRQAYQLTVSDITNRIKATQDALDIGAAETITGVSSWNQATYHAINRMKANGITGFIDHAGRRWNAESYVSMDIRTTLANTARAAVWETNQNFGNDLYQVSYHNGARPLCYPYQNMVISRDDRYGVTYDLDGNEISYIAQSATSYGQPAGLFGINCKHYPTPFIPGVSVIRGEPQDEEDNDRTYAESQQQRALERKIREEKRDLLMLKAQGAPDELLREQRSIIRQTDDEIDEFCKQTGRTRRQNREGVYTKREFPDPKTYDVALFERDQKELIDRYFVSGGSQSNFTFGTMTPKVPITQNAPVASTSAVTPQQPSIKYGEPFNTLGYRKAQVKQIEDARAALDNAPELAQRVWTRCADDFRKPSFGRPDVSGAHYSRIEKHANFKTYKEAFEESSYQRKNCVWFHEHGHNIDNILGGFGTSDDAYISIQYKGGLFGKTIQKECDAAVRKFYLHDKGFKDAFDAVRAAQDSTGGMGFNAYVRQALRQTVTRDEFTALRDLMESTGYAEDTMRQIVDKHLKSLFDNELSSMVHSSSTGKAFCDWVNKTYSIYERGDISDMFERYTIDHYGITFPFGVGHGKVKGGGYYAHRTGATEKEAFAEMFSAYVTQNDSLPVIKDFFPESFALFEEILRSAI